jgi:RNA polymerase primary sigma factor
MVKKIKATTSKKVETSKRSPLDNPMSATTAYVRNINQHDLLSEERERHLVTQLEGDDRDLSEDAKVELIESNLRLVVKIAHEFRGSRLPLRDLISAGNDGLIYSVDKFDPTKGARFATYAVWWIKQFIRRAIEYQSTAIRIPAQTANKLRKIKNARIELARKLDRVPTDTEVAEEIGLTERVVTSLRRVDLSFFSLHELVGSEESTEIMDLIPDEKMSNPFQELGRDDSIEDLYSVMEHLKEREQEVLKLRFGLDGEDPMTLENIAQVLGITRERIRQIQNTAMGKIKKFMAERDT